jgi:hypothetical protein
MYMIAATIKALSWRDPPWIEQLAEVFWSHCELADEVEHIRCISRPGGIEVLLFVQGRDSDSAVAAARSICKRVVSRAPILNGWFLESCVDVTGHLGG